MTAMTDELTSARIARTQRTIAGAVLRTPTFQAPALSEVTGAQVFVKYENMQVTNSFKERGAVNKLASLSAHDRARGRLPPASAGDRHGDPTTIRRSRDR